MDGRQQQRRINSLPLSAEEKIFRICDLSA